MTIRVDNQNKKGRNGTYAIKDLLSSDGYQWRKKAWRCTFSVKDFSIQSFFASANWVSHASGIEVQFYDDLENVIAIYHVDDGQARCITDNFPMFSVSAGINHHKSLVC